MIDNTPDFEKNNGLIPAVIQDANTQKVLMLGYMNEAALAQTLATKRVTFYSRSKQRLWTKGEESGNYLELIELKSDCDNDTLLILAKPLGAVCHTGQDTCWQQKNIQKYGFISKLEQIITSRKQQSNSNSYVSDLFGKGINKIAQKVGEEAVELIIEAKDNNDALFLNEAADLLFHYLILLKARNYSFDDVVKVLEERNN